MSTSTYSYFEGEVGQRSPIRGELERIKKDLDALEKSLRELRIRLMPVSRPEMEEALAEPEAKADTASSSGGEVLSALHICCTTIERLNGEVLEMTERLEV